ncbi:hypothetical protein RHGRI_015192 [Rhododendron griersonianum]|uniref:Uncharacterized protein n=1 Tax=Rhododendron griersonianum TaxID=479676 RepID=A0AAV6KD74_9ERIC|nr:hypothetical protein RHGRI_015192 [Rhododendron griersonianum]
MKTNFANSSHSAAFRAALTWTPKSPPVLHLILTDEPDILTRKDAQGNTILHFLVAGGNATAFRELFDGGLLTRSNGGSGGEMRTWNWRGDTVHHEATMFGRSAMQWEGCRFTQRLRMESGRCSTFSKWRLLVRSC